jgi:toxin FitB
MNVVDSSGWIEYLTKGENGPVFRPVIQDIPNLIVPTIVIYEVFKWVALVAGEETALDITGVLSLGQEAALDRTTAIDAAKISLQLKLSMADSIILAIARGHGAILWTQDAHFKNIEGVQYIDKKP